MSSLEVVRGIEPLDAPRGPGNPLEFAGAKVTPALSQSASAQTGVGLFFVVYPVPDASRTEPIKPRITVEFFQGGKSIARARPDGGGFVADASALFYCA
jgi:hypothetical protein